VNGRDNTPAWVYRCEACNGLQGAQVADPEDTRLMRAALTFKRDAGKHGKSVDVMAVSDVRTAAWCNGACRKSPLEAAS
jgi:hypothetical protein